MKKVLLAVCLINSISAMQDFSSQVIKKEGQYQLERWNQMAGWQQDPITNSGKKLFEDLTKQLMRKQPRPQKQEEAEQYNLWQSQRIVKKVRFKVIPTKKESLSHRQPFPGIRPKKFQRKRQKSRSQWAWIEKNQTRNPQ